MPRILLADDDTDVLNFLSAALAGEGYETLRAETSEAAMAALRKGGVDLVVLDMGMQGLPAAPAEGLKAAAPGVKVLILTGRDVRREKGLGNLRGADVFLEKGCELDQLLGTVRRILRGASPPSPSA